MKVACLVLAICVYSVTALPYSSKVDSSLNAPWEDYKVTFNKKYDEQFESVRRMIWEENLEKVRAHNLLYDLGHKSYALGMNEFADMTFAEFKATFLGYRQHSGKDNSSESFLPPLNMGDLPSEVDWRKKGYVTPVKNQGQCGSCWAFSTTGSLEGQHFRKTGKLVSLSEQQLVDCSGNFGNMGCNGGLMDNAFKYIKANGGIDTEASYPYHATNGNCHFDPNNVGATVSGYVDIPRGDENALQQASATVGPISVAIDASHRSFHLYSHGVYNEDECSSTQLDHGVLVVGYGSENGDDYWLVKNSWGPSWGLSGYIKMSRNKGNQCGIATQASYPTV